MVGSGYQCYMHTGEFSDAVEYVTLCQYCINHNVANVNTLFSVFIYHISYIIFVILTWIAKYFVSFGLQIVSQDTDHGFCVYIQKTGFFYDTRIISSGCHDHRMSCFKCPPHHPCAFCVIY